MEFLSEESDFSKKAREEEDPRGSAGNLLLWVVAIMVLLGLNAFSWIFCMYVFGQPEEPFNYNLLSKLDKVPKLKGFQPTTVPRGKFHTVKELYAQSFSFTPEELANFNDIKKRHYLKNFYERSDVTFLGGDFVVQNIRKLNEKDVFPRGFAIRARAESFPDGLVDFVIPAGSLDDREDDNEDGTPGEPLPVIEIPDALFAPGEAIKIEESSTCAALLNIDRQENDLMVFTVVPLVNRKFTAANGNQMESRPPQRLNMASRRWPLSDNGLVSNPIAPKEPAPEGEESSEEGETVAKSSE